MHNLDFESELCLVLFLLDAPALLTTLLVILINYACIHLHILKLTVQTPCVHGCFCAGPGECFSVAVVLVPNTNAAIH